MIGPGNKRFVNKKRKRDEPEWIVVLFVVLALIAGGLLKVYIETRMIEFSNDEISFSYPENWIVETNINVNDLDFGFRGRTEDDYDKILLKATSMLSESTYKTNVSLRSIFQPNMLPIESFLDPFPGIVSNLANQYEKILSNFNVIKNQKITFNNAQGIRIDYTFVSESILNSEGYSIPVVVYGVDYIVAVNNTAYILTVRFDSEKIDEEMDFCEKMINEFYIRGYQRGMR